MELEEFFLRAFWQFLREAQEHIELTIVFPIESIGEEGHLSRCDGGLLCLMLKTTAIHNA